MIRALGLTLTLADSLLIFLSSPLPVTSSRIFLSPPETPMNATATSAVPPSIKTLRLEIKGRVQGVFFRDWTVQTARELGLNGWVRNRRDGSVEALFSGDPVAVDEMVERRCRVGPPAAMVTAVNVFPTDDIPVQGFQRKPTA